MTKDLKTPSNKGRRPGKRAGIVSAESEAKGNRLTLRMHPDILEVLSFRAAERGVSRSHLVEQILVGMMRADPRNPRLDPVGRILLDAEAPLALRERSPVQLADRWRRFVTAHEIILGAPPSQDWLDDEYSYWDYAKGSNRGPGEQSQEERAQKGRLGRRRRNID